MHALPAARTLHLLDRDERIELALDVAEGELRVTDRRLIVTSGGQVLLQVGYDELRRIEFDIEALTPATMAIVPHRASQTPQMLSVSRDNLHRAAEVLAFVAERMA